MEDDTFVVNGPEPYFPVPKETLGKVTFDNLVTRDCKQIAFVSFFFDNVDV